MNTFTPKTEGPGEGLGLMRFLMVLGSMSPLFAFLAIRGVPVVEGHPIFSDTIYLSVCCSLIGLPALALAFKIFIAGRNKDIKELVIGTSSDHRDHLFAYLFAVVIPLYQNNYNSVRDVLAALAVLAFILFLFVRMNLHYTNLLFAFMGYRVYTIETEASNNAFSGRGTFFLLTKRSALQKQQKIIARRLSDTVYIEYE